MKKSCVPRVKNLQRSLRPKMRQSAAITVIGRDNTGVFTRVTTFLIEQRAGLETLEERATRSQFTMTLQASWVASDCHAAGGRGNSAGNQIPALPTESPPAFRHQGHPGIARLKVLMVAS
jgi:hypothetical protein